MSSTESRSSTEGRPDATPERDDPGLPHRLLTPTQRSLLLDVARLSIAEGLTYDRPVSVECDSSDPPLRETRATFTTIKKHGTLRGCIGSLEASRPLIEDVADSAFRAAFRDARFSRVTESEVPELEIHLSVLTPIVDMGVHSEAELLERLRPGVDGLVIRDGARRATFLPAVWEGLPEPRDFLDELRAKAGMAPGHWSQAFECLRYQVEEWS